MKTSVWMQNVKKWSELNADMSNEEKEHHISQVFDYCRAEENSMYLRATQEEYDQGSPPCNYLFFCLYPNTIAVSFC